MGIPVWKVGSEAMGEGSDSVVVDLWEGDTRSDEGEAAPTHCAFSDGIFPPKMVTITRVRFKSFRWRCGSCHLKGRTAIVPYDGPDPLIKDCRCGARAVQPGEAP